MTTANLMNVSSVNGKFAAQIDSSKKLQDGNLEVAEAFAGLMNQAGMALNQMVDDASSDMNVQVGNTQSAADSYERYSYKDNQIEIAKESSVKEKLEESADTLEKAEQDVVDAISEEYGVSEEEIQNVLEDMGLSVLDLLNPENLVNFIMQLTGAASSEELLLDNSFLNLMGTMNSIAEGLMKNLNVDMNGLQEIISQMELVNNEVEMPAALEDQNPEEAAQNAETADDIEVSVELAKEVSDVKGDSNTQALATEETTLDQNTKENQSFASNQNSEENSLLNHNSNNETVIVNQTDVNTGQAADVSQTQFSTFSSYVSTDTMQIMEQIVQQMRVTVSAETTSMEMQLNPENLGKVYVNISSEEGVVNAQFRTTNEIVKEALETQIATLRENLAQAGVKVDSIEVTIASHEFERNLEQNHQNPEEQVENQENQTVRRRNISIDSLDELSGVLTEEETLVAQMMKENGNSVDFTA